MLYFHGRDDRAVACGTALWFRRKENIIVSSKNDDGLEMNFTPMKGIIGDIRRRAPHYVSDYTAGFHPKVLASTLFLFFACLANAIAFGALTGAVTGNEIGTVEMIAATAVGGIVFAIFSGQPLTILGGYRTHRYLHRPFVPSVREQRCALPADIRLGGHMVRHFYGAARGLQHQRPNAVFYPVYR